MVRVVVVSTGGTIASRRDRQRGSVVATTSGAELIDMLETLAPAVDVTVDEFCTIGSFQMDLELSFRLARHLDAVLADDTVAGVVVTHGTDTMEESAFLADLVVSSDKPVVFTGAQRPADQPDPDGPRNLADALRLAAAPEAVGLGAVILFDQEFHAAREATKTHTSRVGTFTSAGHGKLGEVDGDRVLLYRRPALRQPVATEAIEPRIDLIKLVMGADARFVRCALDTGARGLVLEAFGRGNANPAVVEGVREAVARGIPVVVTSRCPQGRVMPVYGNGGGKDLAEAGALFAGDLSGVKARLLLAVLLGRPGAGTDLTAVLARFAG